MDNHRPIISSSTQTTPASTNMPKKKRKLAAKRKLYIAAILFIVVLIAAIMIMNRQYKNLTKTNTQEQVQQEANDLAAEVGKYYRLPQNEQPTTVEIDNKDSFKNQPLYAKAENGDRLLIYGKANLAILYRPSQKKIITVAPAYTN